MPGVVGLLASLEAQAFDSGLSCIVVTMAAAVFVGSPYVGTRSETGNLWPRPDHPPSPLPLSPPLIFPPCHRAPWDPRRVFLVSHLNQRVALASQLATAPKAPWPDNRSSVGRSGSMFPAPASAVAAARHATRESILIMACWLQEEKVGTALRRMELPGYDRTISARGHQWERPSAGGKEKRARPWND